MVTDHLSWDVVSCISLHIIPTGDGQSDHYHWRKGFPFEFSAHIPMLLRWPETFAESLGIAVPRGAVIDEVSPHCPALRLMSGQAVEC